MENRFLEHNKEVSKVWETFSAGHPIRMPMSLSFNARMYLLDPKYSRGITFQQYSSDPMLMADVQLYGQNIFPLCIQYHPECDHRQYGSGRCLCQC